MIIQRLKWFPLHFPEKPTRKKKEEIWEMKWLQQNNNHWPKSGNKIDVRNDSTSNKIRYRLVKVGRPLSAQRRYYNNNNASNNMKWADSSMCGPRLVRCLFSYPLFPRTIHYTGYLSIFEWVMCSFERPITWHTVFILKIKIKLYVQVGAYRGVPWNITSTNFY